MFDKSLILNMIKEHLNIKTDAEFSSFLGIKPNVLWNWRNRNSIDYELILSKCNDISPEWIMSGKGQMLKTESSVPEFKEEFKNFEVLKGNDDMMKRIIELLENQLQEKERIIQEKERMIEFLLSQNKSEIDTKKGIAS